MSNVDPATENRRRGFWLRMARERANLTQEAVAKSIGLSGKSKSTMSAWEAGTREPSPSKISAMARLYGVPVAVFMEPRPTPQEELDEVVRLASEQESRDWEQGQGRGRVA